MASRPPGRAAGVTASWSWRSSCRTTLALLCRLAVGGAPACVSRAPSRSCHASGVALRTRWQPEAARAVGWAARAPRPLQTLPSASAPRASPLWTAPGAFDSTGRQRAARGALGAQPCAAGAAHARRRRRLRHDRALPGCRCCGNACGPPHACDLAGPPGAAARGCGALARSACAPTPARCRRTVRACDEELRAPGLRSALNVPWRWRGGGVSTVAPGSHFVRRRRRARTCVCVCV